MKLFFSAALSVFALTNLFAQLFTPGSTVPPGTDWQQINTDTVRLVFPKGLEDQANRIVNMVHYQAANNLHSIGDRFRKTDIFLLNQTVIPNGYVTTAPFHSKFYTTFPQRSFYGTTDWLDVLSIHEYRHALQFSNTMHGITKWAYFLTGEAGWGALFSLAIPPWFFEGDAVMQETALSNAGRGRIRSFSAELKTIAALEKPFGYEKMVNGSFRDMVPDHYVLGYDMVRHGRSIYGNDIWAGIFKDAAAYKGGFYPFSRALKRRTGLKTPKFYRSMMGSIKPESPANEVSAQYQSPLNTSDPASYSKPRFMSKDKVMAIKETFSRPAQFVMIDLGDGKETPVIPLGFGMGEYDVNEQILVWSEITLDPRWSDRSYSNIWKYEFSTGKTMRITDKTKFFSPAISPDRKQILVVEVNEMMQNKLILLHASSGNLIREIHVDGGFNFRYPEWNGNDELVVVAQKNNRNAILNIDLNSGKYKELVPFSITSFEDLSISGGKMFFLANEGREQGLNQMMSYDLKTGALFKIPFKTPFLTEMPDAGPDQEIALITTEFNQKRILIIPPQEEKPFIGFNRNPNVSAEIKDAALLFITDNENGPIVDQIPQKHFEHKKYHAGLTKLVLHSWLLMPGESNVSMVLAANDKLGQYGLQWTPGYNFNENVFFSDINMTFGNWFPLFTLGHNSLINRARQINNEDSNDTVYWNESRFYGKVYVPLTFIKRNYRYAFNPQLGYGLSNITDNNPFERSVFHTAFIQLQAGATRKKAYRSIKAPFSFNTDWTISKTLNNEDKINFAGNLNVFLPGIKPTHYIQLIADYRYADLQNEYHPLNNSYYVRGFTSKFLSDQFFGPKINYGFPIWYPDIALGPFVYFKRIRANLFYDIGLEWDFTQAEQFRQVHSTGIELLFDNRYFRMIDLSAGIRAGYKPIRLKNDTEKFFVTFAFDTN